MTTKPKPIYICFGYVHLIGNYPTITCARSIISKRFSRNSLSNDIKELFNSLLLKPNSNVLQAEKANAAHYARQNPICCHILTNIKRKVPKTKSKRVVGHAISKIKSRHITSNVQRTNEGGYPFYYISSHII